MDTILIILVAIVCFFWFSRIKRPVEADLQLEVDPKGFYQGLTLGKVPLYQMLFNEVVDELEQNERLSEITKQELTTKIEKLKLQPVYLFTMIEQYCKADPVERYQNSDRWVAVVTGLDPRERNKKTTYYPSAFLSRVKK